MTKKYRFKRTDLGQTWSDPMSYVRVANRIRKATKLMRPGPFNILRWEEYGTKNPDWGPDRTRIVALTRFLNYIRRGNAGQVWSMRSTGGAKGQKKFQVRIVEIKPKLQDTSGNLRVDRAYTEVFDKWRNAENWGICNCRPIAGSWTWSQHAYCNAIDIHDSPGNMHDISRYLVANKDRLAVYTVIYNRQAWSRRTPYWHSYGGSNPHTDHVHVDFSPQGSGTPGCA